MSVLQSTLHKGNGETTLHIKESLSSRQPLSAISEHLLNTDHQCLMEAVKLLDLEEN